MSFRVNPRLLYKNIEDLVRFTQKRHRVKTKWAATRPKVSPSDLALHNFDASYGLQFGELWPSVRVSLLSEQKYGALFNNFSYDDTVTQLQSVGCRDFVTASVDITSDGAPRSFTGDTSSHHSKVSITPNVRCFVFPKGDTSRFKAARQDRHGLLGYYLMDAASLLPVLALDVQKGESVLDLCAAPGGKTLALLQAQATRFLWVNDWSESRMSRLQRTLLSFLPDDLCSEDKLRITCFDGRKWQELGPENTFDKVLVDVPCTTDRHSLMEENNNIFSRSRTKERQNLPLCQTQLLLSGLQAVRRGGEVMYATCTLSQLQNQCVVEQAMRLAEEELGICTEVVDLQPFTALFKDTFHFAPDMNLGVMVLPHLTANFGPMYFCKLRRLA
ncbi:5-methylcytosine rRNA methyltransferase NSUN4 [Engraulis encrasicolus]|uniref:5-methylcytosine rRNA methyltransferase NSUN4 n=1 Tax=Engraulis encrasicolus TaxID=184585 RepID=UPI002FD38814